LEFLINREYIGGKRHFPEKKLITSRIKWLNKKEQKAFYKEYDSIRHYFFRDKKRTGKGDEWHLSVKTEYLGEIKRLIEL